MNKTLLTALLALFLVSPAHAQSTGAVTPAVPTAPATQALPAVQPPPTTPLQVSIAIGSFKCKVSACTADLGDGVADALATTLLDTGKFSLLERENVSQLTEENFFSPTSPTDGYQGADVLVFGAITNYVVDGQGAGLCLFGVCLGGKESTIGADLRIVDARTRRVIAGAHVDGKSSSTGVTMNFIPRVSMNGSQSTGMQTALNDMLKKAVDQLLQRIPANYYR